MAAPGLAAALVVAACLCVKLALRGAIDASSTSVSCSSPGQPLWGAGGQMSDWGAASPPAACAEPRPGLSFDC